jgi:CBS domain-containing protein
VNELIQNYIMGTDEHAFPVVDDGKVVGLVTLENVRRLDRDARDSTTVRDIMTPGDKLVTATPEEDAADALNKLTQKDVNQLPVVNRGELVGLLRRRDIIRWLQLNSQLKMG